MSDDTKATDDANTTKWKSDDAVMAWLDDMAGRERKRRPQWELMGHLLPFASGDSFTFADLGAGTGAAARAILDLYPNAHAVLADFSPQMMREAALPLAPYRGRFEYVEFDLIAGEWPAQIRADLGAVVTSQCVHHLPDERKQRLFGEIFDRLAPGGWYLNFDPVSPPDASVGATWERANDRLDPARIEKRRNRTPEQQASHADHVRHMTDLDRQLGFLRKAGFEAIDVYWKHLDYVIYGGARPWTA